MVRTQIERCGETAACAPRYYAEHTCEVAKWFYRRAFLRPYIGGRIDVHLCMLAMSEEFHER